MTQRNTYFTNTAIRLYRACTPGTRNRSVLDSGDTVRSDPPQRGLTSGFTPRRGRNNRGIVTSRHRGGGHKRPYRHIDPRRSKRGVPGRIITVEYDPNRSAYISPVHHGDGDKGYISHPEGIRVGDAIPTGPGAPTTVGNAPPPSAARINNSRRRELPIGFGVWPINPSLIQLLRVRRDGSPRTEMTEGGR